MQNYLIVGGRESPIDESGGRRRFCLAFHEGRIPGFQKKIIALGLCDSLLPMILVEQQGELWISYDFTGFIQLPDALFRRKEQGLPVAREASLAIAAAARSVISAENCLLDSDNFPLLPDTIFTEVKTGQVRLAYLPGVSSYMTVQERVLELIRSTGELSEDAEWFAYGEEISHMIRSGNLGLAETALLLGEKAGEMERKQWPAKTMVRETLPEGTGYSKAGSKKEKYHLFSGRK